MAVMQKSLEGATTSQRYRGEVRIFYASPLVVIIENPLDGEKPMVVLKQKTPSFWDQREEVRRALDLCDMELIGEPSMDENGLWYCPVQVKGG